RLAEPGVLCARRPGIAVGNEIDVPPIEGAAFESAEPRNEDAKIEGCPIRRVAKHGVGSVDRPALAQGTARRRSVTSQSAATTARPSLSSRTVGCELDRVDAADEGTSPDAHEEQQRRAACSASGTTQSKHLVHILPLF